MLRVQGSITCGVPASFLAVTVQGFNVWGVQGFKCLKSFVFMNYGLELGIWNLEFGIWYLVFGTWYLLFVICDLWFVICDL